MTPAENRGLTKADLLEHEKEELRVLADFRASLLTRMAQQHEESVQADSQLRKQLEELNVRLQPVLQAAQDRADLWRAARRHVILWGIPLLLLFILDKFGVGLLDWVKPYLK